MHYEDYRSAQIRMRGPLFAAEEALTGKFSDQLATCDEGEALLKEARDDVAEAIQSVSRLLSYVARMNDFDG